MSFKNYVEKKDFENTTLGNPDNKEWQKLWLVDQSEVGKYTTATKHEALKRVASSRCQFFT